MDLILLYIYPFSHTYVVQSECIGDIISVNFTPKLYLKLANSDNLYSPKYEFTTQETVWPYGQIYVFTSAAW